MEGSKVTLPGKVNTQSYAILQITKCTIRNARIPKLRRRKKEYKDP